MSLLQLVRSILLPGPLGPGRAKITRQVNQAGNAALRPFVCAFGGAPLQQGADGPLDFATMQSARGPGTLIAH
jgi:hypothetical protein